MTKGLLLKAVQGNKELSDIITKLEEKRIKGIKLATLKTEVLKKASSVDRQETYLKLVLSVGFDFI